MKILYICGAGIFSGLETLTFDLIGAARAAGHEVFCLTSLWGNGEFASRLEAEGFNFQRTWLGFVSRTPRWKPLLMTLDQGRRLPTLWRDFCRVVREWKPDIIHHTNFHHVFLLACGPTRLGVPNIYHIQNALKTRRLIFKVIDRYVDRFVAPNDFVKRSLLELGVDEDKIGVVLNGVPEPSLKSGKGRLWRRRSGWREGDVLVGIVGQIGAWKGHEDFIKAVALAQREDPCVKGVVIGSGSEKYVKYLRGLADNCRPNSVLFAGYFSDMSLAYSELDLVVVPSRSEDPSPIAVIKAMSHGLPVIGTSRGGIPELFGDELKEWLVPPGNPVAIAEKILLLAKDTSLREQVGRRTRGHASRNFALGRCSKQMIDEYKSLVLR